MNKTTKKAKLSDFGYDQDNQIARKTEPIEITPMNIDDIVRFATKIGVTQLELTKSQMEILVMFVSANMPHLLDQANYAPKDLWVEKLWGITLTKLEQ